MVAAFTPPNVRLQLVFHLFIYLFGKVFHLGSNFSSKKAFCRNSCWARTSVKLMSIDMLLKRLLVVSLVMFFIRCVEGKAAFFCLIGMLIQRFSRLQIY